MTDNLFDIKIGYASFKNSIALVSMAGTTGSAFASKFANAGLVVLGGYYRVNIKMSVYKVGLQAV